jgi:tetratricopeptide (TPR) repeat protein
MRIPRRLLYSSLVGSLAIASVALPARAQTRTHETAGEPPRIKPIIPSPQQPGALTSCDEQIKNRFADNHDSSRANYELGWCYLHSKKFDDAAAAFQQSIELIPEWIKQREEQAASRLPELSKEEKEELQRNANPSLARFSLGWAHHQAERYDEAVAEYRQIKVSYPAGEEARYQTAMAHLAQGNREAAAEQVAQMGERFERRFDIESKLLIPDLTSPTVPASGGAPTKPMSASTRPTILYREKAKYTEEARQAKMQGTVVLQAIFRSDGVIVIPRVIRYLPYGLTLKAVEAASKIRFTPATKNESPISVRGTLEFTFNLY